MEINDVITDLTKKFKHLLDCINNGKRIAPQFFIDFFGKIEKCSFDFGNDGDESLYQLHSHFIKQFLNESINILKKTSNIDFINLFNKQIDKIKLLLYWLNRIPCMNMI